MTSNLPNPLRIYSRLQRTITTTRFPLLPSLLLAVLIPGVLHQLYSVYRITAVNHSIIRSSPLAVADDDPPQVLFAKAHYLDSQGQYQEALQLYNIIEHHDGKAFRERVKYNMGTIYLREAAKQWNSQGVWAYAQINSLVKLAEEAFREVLRINNENWDARYNLEYALRIRPPEKTAEKADWEGRKRSVYAIFPGIPGGGP